jgi:hypothetical protein
MLNILLGSGVEAFLGVAILNSHRPLASMYTLSSSKTGGGILWAATEVVTLGAFVPIFLQWMHSEQRVALRSDARGGDSVSFVGTGAGLYGLDDVPSGNSDGDAAPSRAPAAAGSLSPASLAARAAAANASRGLGRVQLDVPLSQLSPWEYAWLARTGTVPSRFVVPDHAPGPEDLEEGAGSGG